MPVIGFPPSSLLHSAPILAVIPAFAPPETVTSPSAEALTSAIRSELTDTYTGTAPTIKVYRAFTMSSIKVKSVPASPSAAAAILSAKSTLNPPSRETLKY